MEQLSSETSPESTEEVLKATFDEKVELKDLKQSWKSVQKAFTIAVLDKIRPESLDYIEQLEMAIQDIPPRDVFQQMVEDLVQQTRVYIDRAKVARVEAFSALLAAYIRQKKEQNASLREMSRGWRIDRLELETRPETARIRFLYNKDPLTPWTAVRAVEDFHAVERKARAFIEKYESYPGDDELAEWFWTAYEEAHRERAVAGALSGSASIPILAFYRAFRLHLVRRELNAKGPAAKLTQSDLPKVAFLIYFDRYLSFAGHLPPERRLGLQTGSQREVAQGKGLVVGGFRSQEDYRVMCHIVAHPSR